MNIDCETLEGLKALAPWVAIGVTIIVLIVQIIRSRFAQSVDLILKLEQRFFGSEDMTEARKRAAEALRSSPSSPSSDIEDVLDFFDTLGLLVRRKALDKEMVWHTFYHWIHRYWLLSNAYITEKQKIKPTLWEDLTDLEKQIVSMERKRSKSNADIDLSEDDLKEFLNDECNF